MLLARKGVKILSALRDDNYFVVHGWMINKLGLKGTELELYAIIYGFSQAEGQKFHGGLQYLADWTNVSKRNVIVRLQSLVEKGFLVKEDVFNNGVKTCEYRCRPIQHPDDETSPGVVMKRHRAGDETSPGWCRNITGSGDETSHNKESYKESDKESYKESDIEEKSTAELPGGPPGAIAPDPKPSKTSRFKPPTLEEVRAYCLERGNNIDPEKFHSYYESVKWYRGKTKIQDWKACIRTWESKERSAPGQAQRQQHPAPPPPRKGGNIFLDMINEGM